VLSSVAAGVLAPVGISESDYRSVEASAVLLRRWGWDFNWVGCGGGGERGPLDQVAQSIASRKSRKGELLGDGVGVGGRFLRLLR